MIKQQQGVVLVVALVFLIALTAVASALMLNTTTDIKLSGASEQKLIATQEAISAVDETVAQQLTSGTNLFAQKTFPKDIITTVQVTDTKINNANNNNVIADCAHSRLASSNELLKCNVLTITVNNNYGVANTSNINVNAGITQQLLNVGN